MPYPGNFLRAVFAGPLYAAERWSFSLSFIEDFGVSPGLRPTAVPSGWRAALQTFASSASLSGVAKVDSIKLNMITPAGLYLSEDTVEEVTDPAAALTGSTSAVAPQVALAVSLRTIRERGIGHAGRFYLPVPTHALGSDGRLTIAQAQAVATAATTFLQTLNTSLDGWRCGIASDSGAGVFQPVTHVAVGRVLDTIRSRRTSLPEDHVLGGNLST